MTHPAPIPASADALAERCATLERALATARSRELAALKAAGQAEIRAETAEAALSGWTARADAAHEGLAWEASLARAAADRLDRARWEAMTAAALANGALNARWTRLGARFGIGPTKPLGQLVETLVWLKGAVREAADHLREIADARDHAAAYAAPDTDPEAIAQARADAAMETRLRGLESDLGQALDAAVALNRSGWVRLGARFGFSGAKAQATRLLDVLTLRSGG